MLTVCRNLDSAVGCGCGADSHSRSFATWQSKARPTLERKAKVAQRWGAVLSGGVCLQQRKVCVHTARLCVKKWWVAKCIFATLEKSYTEVEVYCWDALYVRHSAFLCFSWFVFLRLLPRLTYIVSLKPLILKRQLNFFFVAPRNTCLNEVGAFLNEFGGGACLPSHSATSVCQRMFVSMETSPPSQLINDKWRCFQRAGLIHPSIKSQILKLLLEFLKGSFLLVLLIFFYCQWHVKVQWVLKITWFCVIKICRV